MLKFRLLFIFTILSLVSTKIMAQEINATVTVNMEQLPFELRTNVTSMENDLQKYINSQRFTDAEWQGDKIPVDITIYLNGGANNRYGGRLLIVSRRKLDIPGDDQAQSVNMRFLDNQWHFNYGLGANFTYNPLRFDEFISLIDYYMNLVIGFDMDTYGELDGTKMFDKAKSIVQLGSSAGGEGYETYTKPGDFNRYNLVTELTDLRFEPLRKLFFAYYVDGIEKLATKKEAGLAGLDSVIHEMAIFKREKLSSPSVLIQAFFDSKGQELAAIFNGYGRKEVFEDLKYLDVGNTILYQDSKDGKLK